ncbi:MAG: hypothetical protein QM811_10950 [Pirellulales bacterium]
MMDHVDAAEEESARIEQALAEVRRKFEFAGGPSFTRNDRAISVEQGSRYAIGNWETIWSRAMLADTLDQFWMSLSGDRMVVLTG